ncbi:YceI-like domain-containing protein [Nonomuraea polychroma]|uniref:YceI-like domain-containing protein n=1 Tax=Nonomuraea polychroma TaxID=46176 RepID=A0A438M5Q5_9ACTN|nr:YceI family protein [Nonomuraea polychroma]RVX40991.1 YceI-like domain-containing protein [Nonomuraea polychroma]
MIGDDNRFRRCHLVLCLGSFHDGTPAWARNAEWDEHLRGADYLDTSSYPTASFESSGVREEDGRFAVDGLLTIRGETRPVTLSLEFLGVAPDAWGAVRAGFRATTRLSRSEFGVTGNLPLGGGAR